MHRLTSLALSLTVTATLATAQQPAPPPQMNADQQSPTTVYNLPSQPVGVNDLLAVTVYDSPELSRTVRVGADGTIRLPMLKQKITVIGQLPSQIETSIATAFSNEAILVDPVVTVSVAEYKSRPISVVGAVKSPLTFQALPGTTLLDAITKAQGLTDTAGPDIIVTRRLSATQKGAGISQRIAARALIDGKDQSLNIPLTGGEEVRVPEAEHFFVVGQVHKPGAYPFRQQDEATVVKAVALSEGLDQFASKIAYVIRKEGPSGQQELPIELAKILQRKAADVPLQPNDVLYIPDSKSKRLAFGSVSTLVMLGGAATSAAIYATR